MMKSFHEVSKTESRNPPPPMLPAGFASPAFLLAGIYYHCRHQLHAPRFFTSFRMTAPAGRLHGAWRLPSFPCTNDTIATPPPCHFDRSGEISLLHGTSRIGAGGLSTQSFNRAQAHLPPLRHAAPLEMTNATGRLASLEKDGSRLTVISTEVEKSPSPMLLTGLPLPPSCRQVFTIIAVTSSMHRDSSLRSE